MKWIKEYLSKYFLLCLGGAILYCIPVFYFINISRYSGVWLLYLGNGLFLAFMFVITAFVLKSEKPMITGHIITVICVVLSCLLILVMILFLSPGAIDAGSTEKILLQSPTGISHKATHGMLLILFANAIIGNFSAGSFATIITSQAVKESARDKG